MNKRIINTFILISLLLTLAYFINNARIQNNNFYKVNNHIERIILFNKDFNLYLKNSFKYNNFDIIQEKITSSKIQFEKLKNNITLLKSTDTRLNIEIKELDITLREKLDIINRVNSYRAILNKSYVIIQKIRQDGINEKLNNLYMTIMTLDKNPSVDMEKTLKNVYLFKRKYTKKNDKFFLKHCTAILKYKKKLDQINLYLEKTPLEKDLHKFHEYYNSYSLKIIEKAYLSIIILFILLILSLIFYLIYDYKLSKSRKELKRFRKTVENSDNIIVITDEKIKIKYVNNAFTKITGYTLDEVKGKNPKMLSSGNQSKEFYKSLNQTIFNGEKWSGEFINISKSGDLSYEQATITPVFDEDRKIVEFVAIKLDTTKETLAQDQLIKKEKLLLQQSKMAAMGEMLQNIAHQWRQPLSLISTASTGLMVKKEMQIVTTPQEDIKILNIINDATQHLSETINAFRDFFNPNKEKINFKLQDVYKKTLNIVETRFKSMDIEIIENLEDISITNLDNELIQVMMNLLNNARDILETMNITQKLIFVNIYTEDNNVIISVKDNGGGIDEKIITKIFEPYFTTKHQSQGTGIGLYMCQEIISKHMEGEITVSNQSFEYKGINYTGAEFKIIFPKSI